MRNNDNLHGKMNNHIDKRGRKPNRNIVKMALAGALVFSPIAVQAADPVNDQVVEVIPPQLDAVGASSIWTGAYAGLYGGLKWNSVGVMGSKNIDISNSKNLGGYVGINQELGNSIVGGLEWQGGYSGKEDRAAGIGAKQDWETSLRARMGYAVEQNLVYGLAGVGASQLELTQAGKSDQRWLTGYTVGAGVERQFTDRITGRVEYDYSDYGAKKFDLGAGSTKSDLSTHGLKLGLGYKF